MAIANTTIRIKKSLISGNAPSTLANGEIAINSVDGKLYYSTPSGSIQYINNQQTFATINANSSLILASSTTDTLTINPSNNIVVIANTVAKSITLSLANNISVSGNITIGSGTGGNITGANNIYANSFYANAPNAVVYVTQSQVAADITATNSHLYTLGIFTGNNDQSIQLGAQNFANTQNSSTDLALYNNKGTDSNNYIDMGITSASYNVILNNFTAASPGDAYLYANGANLLIGAYTTGTNLKIFAGGYNAANVTAIHNAPNTASISNTTGSFIVYGGAGITGNVYANGVYTNGLYYAANGNPISSTVTLSDAINSNSSANAATSNAVYIAVSTALAFSIALG
jgi:hypothetical protein